MLNVPVAGGTSGHLVGGALLGILAGPAAGLLAMAVILTVQALLFGDGGIAALGINILNMGVVGVLGGWALHRLLAGPEPTRLRSSVSAAMAGWIVVVAGAALCAVELALSGTAPIGDVLPAMTGIHLAIALIEAGVTGLTIAALHRQSSVAVSWPVAAAVAACAAAPFASALPDGLESAAAQLGFAQTAVAGTAPLMDYAVPGLAGGMSTVVAGLIGVVAVVGAVWLLSRTLAARRV
jgi:cobalt/nickel transport system permease protein